MKMIPKSLLCFNILTISALTACSSQHKSPQVDNVSALASTPSAYMQIRNDAGIVTVYADKFLSHSVGGVGAGMPVIRMLTETLSNGRLVMLVNVRGGTFANQRVWVDANLLSMRDAGSQAAYEAQAEELAIQARDSGAVAEQWQAAANAARFLCMSGVGATAAMNVLTMGADAVGKSALIALVGFQTIKPLLDCAGIDSTKWGS